MCIDIQYKNLFQKPFKKKNSDYIQISFIYLPLEVTANTTSQKMRLNGFISKASLPLHKEKSHQTRIQATTLETHHSNQYLFI